jgi:hypothetical protein
MKKLSLAEELFFFALFALVNVGGVAAYYYLNGAP